MRSAEEIARDLLDNLPCTVDRLVDVILKAREEMRMYCLNAACCEQFSHHMDTAKRINAVENTR